MWIEREISDALAELTSTFPVVVLTGPRQTGKTSILEKTFPDYRYVSLDVPQIAEAAETRPMEFLESYPPPVLIDEVQYAPDIFRHIKTVVDSKKNGNGLFVLTGSQSFPLMEAVSESLAGRAAILPFLGLSMSEWEPCGFQAKKLDFLWKGSFPGLWADESNAPDRNRWYQGYVASYLERDVRALLNVGSLRDFERFLRAAATRIGRILNMSEIGRDVGISPTTAKQWFSVLQASNQVFLLEPYYRSLGKRITKSPKLYFTDTGLASYLAGFSSAQSLKDSHYMGYFWENHVVVQWLRWRDRHSPASSLWFWQDRTKNEVDLIVDADQLLYPIECKWKERLDKSDAKGIAKLRKFYGDSVGPASIACTTEIAFDVAPRVTARSGWKPWDLSN